MAILVTDLRGICHTIMLAADSGGICDIDDVHVDSTEICHRADSTADLGELCRKSYSLPNPTIPALPSYELRADLDVSNDTSQLKSPQLGLYDNYTLSSLKPPSSESSDPLALLSFTAFAMRCAVKPATTSLGHYLDQMAFATTVMNGIALAASGQQLHSADGILLESSLLSEAQNWDDWTKWKEAMITEMDSMQKMDIFELVDLPTDCKLIGVCLDDDQTFSPVIHLQTVCILLTLAQRYKLHVAQLDVSTAFLNGKIDKTIHI
ncbi:uncharacterized protein UDID_17687 [Ustilago sp. UG-2017a]|nr:uncharacterized protein UDID_17687 [Ustilago sp. UG-2017a]